MTESATGPIIDAEAVFGIHIERNIVTAIVPNTNLKHGLIEKSSNLEMQDRMQEQLNRVLSN